jgi:hypothetical protein
MNQSPLRIADMEIDENGMRNVLGLFSSMSSEGVPYPRIEAHGCKNFEHVEF